MRISFKKWRRRILGSLLALGLILAILWIW